MYKVPYHRNGNATTHCNVDDFEAFLRTLGVIAMPEYEARTWDEFEDIVRRVGIYNKDSSHRAINLDVGLAALHRLEEGEPFGAAAE